MSKTPDLRGRLRQANDSEIERLTAALDQAEQRAAYAYRALRATEARLSAEREARERAEAWMERALAREAKLREALRQIAEFNATGLHKPDVISSLQTIARRALKEIARDD